MENSLRFAQEQDQKDPLRELRSRFIFPQHQGKDVLYFCGNSLGLQPVKAAQYVQEELSDWAKLGVEGHFNAKRPWLPYHENVTASLARLAGAKPSEVVAMNTLTVNLHLLLASFFRPKGKKTKILIEAQAFPSDIYAVKSQLKWHGLDPEENLIIAHPRPGEHTIDTGDLLVLMETHADQLAFVLLGQVNFVTGQAFEVPKIVSQAHDLDIFVGLDLAHGMGNLSLQLHDWNVDFAVWCSYKYLNSGPGSLGGAFIHERHVKDKTIPRLEGWWGHNKSNRFTMPSQFEPIETAEAWQLSNPPILPLACMRASLDVFDEVSMTEYRKKSVLLTGFLEMVLDSTLKDVAKKITPTDPQQRGCQLSYLFDGNAKEVSSYLSKSGVICDARGQVARFAPTPLYNRFEDVYQLGQVLHEYYK